MGDDQDWEERDCEQRLNPVGVQLGGERVRDMGYGAGADEELHEYVVRREIYWQKRGLLTTSLFGPCPCDFVVVVLDLPTAR